MRHYVLKLIFFGYRRFLQTFSFLKCCVKVLINLDENSCHFFTLVPSLELAT